MSCLKFFLWPFKTEWKIENFITNLCVSPTPTQMKNFGIRCKLIDTFVLSQNKIYHEIGFEVKYCWASFTLHLKIKELSINFLRDFKSVLDTIDHYWFDPAKYFCPILPPWVPSMYILSPGFLEMVKKQTPLFHNSFL